ncbi:uncharacterized protein LOC126909135 [Daktulosphaira vitifoliae]|uniref:uncharacterized protein LOC126909135 n=1 Tax=Daktulosphaira vitifoliae TaxID=58002 RepID=UPI0021AA235C|nr:uncharacterized protein LOC126909135 [Daktulosphaira vitifoliae]
MYFYIFFVVYLANNFSNGLIFETNPLDENKELIDSSLPALETFFKNNKEDKNGMKFEEFAKIVKEFDWLYEIPRYYVMFLFSKYVGNLKELMNFEQFKKIATFCICIYEIRIENTFKYYSNETDKMTLVGLTEALDCLKYEHPEGFLIKCMNYFEGEGAQFISMKAFRHIFGFTFQKKVKALQENKKN